MMDNTERKIMKMMQLPPEEIAGSVFGKKYTESNLFYVRVVVEKLTGYLLDDCVSEYGYRGFYRNPDD